MDTTPIETSPYTVERSDRFNKWLKQLKDKDAIGRILVRIRRLQQGNLGGFRFLTGSLFELKIDYGLGYRVYCYKKNDKIVLLLLGGNKSSQQADIKTAKKMIKDLES